MSRIVVIIPALDEERAIGRVLDAIPAHLGARVIVVDNGSTDRTAAIARDGGAKTVYEPVRGYGAACQAGLAAAGACSVVVFLDGDFSDDPSQMFDLVEPILADEADLVLGSRALGARERGSLTPVQVFGNALATRLIRLTTGVRYTDLGPFRAIRRSALEGLRMRDRTYGWTVEMQLKAALAGLRVREVPVSYRRRIGTSKISGTIRGAVLAGLTILATVARWGLWPGRRFVAAVDAV
jgi:glycosyltransferase involved in cell wall biosynthesis